MKRTKKFASLLLALVMVLALNVSAFAAMQGTLDGGSITIKDAVPGQQYNAYQILYIESYNAEANAYSYKANPAWEAWLKTQTDYVSFDDQGYVTWVGEATADRAQAFAQLAQAKRMTADATATAPAAVEGQTYSKVEFNNLKLGYYLIDSTLGTLCSIDTTNPNATIKEKNEVPENEKKVEEDSNSTYGTENDADIGQTVNFQSTITAQAGAENYVFHDKMSAGLTFTGVTKVTLNRTDVDKQNYEVVTTGLTDDCTFEVKFAQTFCNTLKANDQLVIEYTAKLNENAVVGVKGNPNESKIEYGQSGATTTTPPSTTTTYTWDLDVLKYGNGEKEKVLKDAQFVLLNKDKDKVAVVVDGKLTGWTNVPAAGENGTIIWPANTVLTTNAQGKIKISGLDSDTYYLREIKAPAGYNTLKQDVEVVITGATKGEGSDLTYKTVLAEIQNLSGTELPSTGGIGTTIFYVLGSVLVVAAGVLLVTKKRMNSKD